MKAWLPIWAVLLMLLVGCQKNQGPPQPVQQTITSTTTIQEPAFALKPEHTLSLKIDSSLGLRTTKTIVPAVAVAPVKPTVVAPTPSKIGLKLPGDSARLLPLLRGEIQTHWPKLQKREFVAGVIDQESNWKVGAKLKTSREFGCGLSQHTIAYNADGTVRFDALAETRRLHPSLAGWNWEDCYNETYQLRAVTIKLSMHAKQCDIIMGDSDGVLKCAGAIYNGGAGGFSKRVTLCRSDPDCNPRVWEDNLEDQCPQSKQKVHGYGESFCEINSKYPGRVFARMPKFNGTLAD